MPSLITSLHQSLKITPLDGDQVKVTVTLPSELLNDYYDLLKSLTGFVNAINHQKHLERLKLRADQTQQSFRNRSQLFKRIVKDYDCYLLQGLTRNEAIKQISANLRNENHPWRSPDLVRKCLIEAGRPGRVGRPRRSKS